MAVSIDISYSRVSVPHSFSRTTPLG